MKYVIREVDFVQKPNRETYDPPTWLEEEGWAIIQIMKVHVAIGGVNTQRCLCLLEAASQGDTEGKEEYG